ncbi:hypothetical protein HER10_EVM0004276 [Colletotrichum scovillei]|uniref:Uncharacterized protein n=1 Tax=Colletotrichum scovillei TaxID=1209932 RepID=A0A9P7RAG0_9PEZI|nr:uncharacterized protein HER10_EVM0004276 [Colletotrichum scovillei]KAF4782920.1 hypothetical protein HER10_EVM0004276 [Colletotrichum scovillei]KAG7053038.1 hypothetical protein JMJ77_0000130 [Colletotrichum scovillei]KAG7071337.1 hypothetical protein JMJ76_0004210 [Colletotrichum scovillei]KAG7079555.1 hypothetical protein JMJ78_0006662 [Colletotrichum scovillei]
MHTFPTPISLQPRETPLPVAARQEETGFHVITQTIYRPSSTFVTYVTLGSGPPTSYSDGNPADPPPAAAPTTDPPPPDRSGGSLSSAQIGGILGGIVAFVAIVLIAWFCISQNKRRPGPPPDWDSLYDYDSSSESGVTGSRGPRTPRMPPPIWGPGGRRRPPGPHPGPIPQAPPPQPFHINRYDAWKVKTNGPFRRQQPPPPQRYRTRVF